MKYDGYQVGIVIKSLRIQRNLTKEALATELGISESTIKKYENGERALSITNLFKIIDYFKVDANTILNVAAVSYTHLDVYKRQTYCRTNMEWWKE